MFFSQILIFSKLSFLNSDISIFSFKVAIIYDKNWFAKYVTHGESINAARRVVANSQILFRWPSLTIPIQLEVASITFQNIDIPASYDTTKPSYGM